MGTGKSEASFIRFEIHGTSFAFSNVYISGNLDEDSFLSGLFNKKDNEPKEKWND